MNRFGPIAALLAFAVAAASADDARAAYLPPSLGEDLAVAAPSPADGAASRSTLPPRQSDAPLDPDRETPTRLAAAPASAGSLSGTGGPGGSSGAAPATPLPASGPAVVDDGRLTAYLVRESRCTLPVPFLDGIFRPPRA